MHNKQRKSKKVGNFNSEKPIPLHKTYFSVSEKVETCTEKENMAHKAWKYAHNTEEYADVCKMSAVFVRRKNVFYSGSDTSKNFSIWTLLKMHE
jgi:hypothetical protein